VEYQIVMCVKNINLGFLQDHQNWKMKNQKSGEIFFVDSGEDSQEFAALFIIRL